jgi:hypothetical protein
MANKVWSWFKKAAHYIAIGVQDVEKFLQTSGALNLISLFPMGGAVATGIGIFEKGLAAAADAEKAAAIFAPGQSGTGPQKLLMAAPEVEKAFLEFANAAGLKINDQSKLKGIAAVVAGAGADFWNIVEPKNNVGLPTPNVPATPATPTAPAQPNPTSSQ